MVGTAQARLCPPYEATIVSFQTPVVIPFKTL
jgi:hypothetical protein